LDLTTVALTGPDGVLGRHIDARLRQCGYAVLPVGRDAWDLRENRTVEELDRVLNDARLVVHGGALTPKPGVVVNYAELCDVNIRASVLLGTWAALRKIPLIYIGSAGIYASGVNAAAEDAPLAPVPDGGFYGLTKLLCEMALSGLQAQGLSLCALRVTSIYGAGLHPDKVVAKMLRKAALGETIKLVPPVDDGVNLVHASDVADAVLSAIERKAHGIFNVGGPAVVTMMDLARACIAVAGKGDVAVDAAPEPLGHASMHRFDVNNHKAYLELGYVPKVQLDSGLKMMLEGRYVV